MTSRTSLTIAAATLVTLTGCSPTGTPLIDMCQKITANLVGSALKFDSSEKVEVDRGFEVLLAYSEETESGVAMCFYEGDKTSPDTVTLNDERVGMRDLIRAAASSSGDMFRETADETAKQSKKLAGEASQKAGELADDAKVLAGDAKVKAGELANRAGELAEDASVRAGELANVAKDKAGVLAGQATELAGEAGDKARAAALEATKALQEKLEQ